ncbi:hypothetical protein SASPL_123575 [Salvia splendens]|uniref:4-amino-4-deoxychorismate lyase n=1 Tax=Salvia splendens TaxID=180675 RepID=A0A8X8XLA8_SALSN|nr:hypothetical protein SASPL_123575 [Salvia splendens]
MTHAHRFLCKNGVVSPAADIPPVAAFLEAQPGAYTTTRTHSNVSQVLFWERHLSRISNSFKLLLREKPNLLLQNPINDSTRFWKLSTRSAMWESVIRSLVHDSMKKVMPLALEGRNLGEELAITVLLSGNGRNLDLCGGTFDEGRISEVLDVYLHVGGYIPTAFGSRESANRLAVVGRGRDFANAKYADWVRFMILLQLDLLDLEFLTFGSRDHLAVVRRVFLNRLRKSLERLRPPSVTELLLSNDGERILEGCLTNFFVISLKEKDEDVSHAEQSELQSWSGIEVQTAPLTDGVLPGVVRQVIRDICLSNGIPFREVSPSWSKRDLWLEVFVTSKSVIMSAALLCCSSLDVKLASVQVEFVLVGFRLDGLRIIQPVETIQAPCAWESVESSSWKDIQWVEKRFQNGPGMITSMLQKEILEKASVESYPVALF